MALTWTTPAGSIGTYTETKPIEFHFVASSSTAGTIQYTLSSGYLPTGTTLSISGLLSGVPLTDNTDGPQVIWFGVTATLFDINGQYVEQINETFNVSIAPWLNWVTKAGSLGEYGAYGNVSIKLETRIPPVQMSYVRYSLVTGTLPTGLILDSTAGTITGKPTTTDLYETSTFSILAKGYTFSGVEVAQQTQQFSITIGMWATPPLGLMNSNIVGPFTGGQPIHPVQFVCSPGSTDFDVGTGTLDKIRYRIVERGLPVSLSVKKITYNGVANVTVAELVGTPPVVLADTEFSFTLRVIKQKSSNVYVSQDRVFVYRVLARSQPRWIDHPGPLGNSVESTQFTHVFSAHSAVPGDIVNFELLNGSYPAGNLLLTQTANNTATLSGTLSPVKVATTTPFTLRAIEKNNTTVVGISDRTFDITVVGPTPPTFATTPGMLADMSTRYYADVPAPPISKITIINNRVVISVSPYNLTNYGITNNTPVYIAGITGGTASTLLNNNMYYVGNADSSNSTFELFLSAGANNTPLNPLTLVSITYTGGGTVGRVSLDSTYFETTIKANLNDPGVTATFTLESGLLPDGLEMNSNGLISGYPTSKRTTLDDAGLPVYWGAVDVNGNPTTKLSTFTVRVTTESGTTTAEYAIAILNQEAAWSVEQYVSGTNFEFPGRRPVLLNTRPLTQVISNTDPYFAYYSTGSNIGRFTQDNQLVYKMIGHNFNAGETESPEYGLTYTITGLSAGVADNANAFAPTIATFSNNNSYVTLTTMNTLGTPTVIGGTISFIGSNVGNKLLDNGDNADDTTYVGNTMKYYWTTVAGKTNTIQLFTNKDTNIANVVTKVLGDLVTPTANGNLQTSGTIATFSKNNSYVTLTTMSSLGTPTIIGSTISFIGSNVGNMILEDGTSANTNTYVGNTMKYYWSTVPDKTNTIKLYTNKDTNIANVITRVVGDLVTPTANGTLQTLNATTLISPIANGEAANGWINGTLGNIGTDINTYRFNVTVSAPNLVANVNTTANISNYSSIILVGNTYGLTVGRTINFLGNSIGNISNSKSYTIASVANTVTLPATIIASNANIAISDTTGLTVNANVTFSDTLGNVAEGNVYKVASISSGTTITTTFAANTPNIVVDTLSTLALDQPITLAKTVDGNLSNIATYFIRSLSNTIITSASTTTNSTVTVNSTQGLEEGANITISNVTPRSYTKVVTATMTATDANYYANSNLSDLTLANYTGNLILVAPDATNISNIQRVEFANLEFGNISNANVSNVYTAWLKPAAAGQARRRVTLVALANGNALSNATGSMTAKFIEPNATSVNTTANYYQVGTISGSTITLVERANTSNVLNPGTHATVTLTTLNKNNITISNTINSNTVIKSTASLVTTANTRNPTITLANLTPNTSGTLTLNYAAKHITVSSNGNVIVANASTDSNNTISIYSTDQPPLVSGPHEYYFVMAGTINTGIGWSSPDGNLGTITTGSTSMLSIDATFGSDSIETTATIKSGNINIDVVSAKGLLQYQPVTFTGNNVGNISNVATYYIKSNVSDTSTSLTISRSLSGNVVVPNVSGTMTLRSSVSDGRFKLLSGSLPPGLKLLSTGDIVGRVAFQPTETYQIANTTTTYNFTVRAYSKKYAEITKDQEFSITTVQKYVDPYDNLYVNALVKEEQRTKIDNLLVHISGTQDNDVTKNIYRSGDANFGVASGIKYGHMYGVPSKSSGTFYEAYAAAIAKNHYFKNLTLGSLKTAVARDTSGKIVYEVVYSPIQDNLISSAGVSVAKEVVQAAQTLYPNSLINMRQQIEDTIGRINNSDVLPLWMVTQQTDGNVLGFVSCWVLCYTKPGKSSVVLSSISTYLADNYLSLNQISFDMDRFEVDRALTYTYGGTTVDTWPELTATFTTGNSAITVNSTVGLTNNQPVKFTGTAVEGVFTEATYWVSNVVANTIWVRTQQYGNIENNALIPRANGTMTLSTVPKSTMVQDDSQDTYVIFTQNNIIK